MLRATRAWLPLANDWTSSGASLMCLTRVPPDVTQPASPNISPGQTSMRRAIGKPGLRIKEIRPGAPNSTASGYADNPTDATSAPSCPSLSTTLTATSMHSNAEADPMKLPHSGRT